MEIGSIPFSSQFMLNPIDLENAALKLEWLHFYLDKDLPPVTNYIGVDPSPSGRAGTDYFALAVLGIDAQQDAYLSSAYRIQIDPLEQASRIRLEAGVWRPAVITVEAVAAQALFTRYMIQGPERRLPIVESTTRFPKELRFIAMARLFESGRIKIRGELTPEGKIVPADSVSDFVEEWVSFTPKGQRDDTLDATEKAIEGARLLSGNPIFISAHPDNVPKGRRASPSMARGVRGGRLLRGSYPRGRRLRGTNRRMG